MASNTVLFTERRHVSTKHSFYNLIGSGQSNVITMFGNNVGIGTTAPRSKLDITGDLRFSGVMYDEDDYAIWIPGSTLQWMDTTAPLINLPTGATLSNLEAKASYRYIGNEVVYNFNTNNKITAPATVSTANYSLTLPQPLKTATYASNSVIGDLLLNVTNATDTLTTTYKAYALVNADNTKATVRYLNGTTDASLAEFPINFTFRLQGTITYASPNIANNQPLPSTALPGKFVPDQDGHVAFNTGQTATARFDVKEDSATFPALKVTQAGTGDIIQVVDGLAPVLVIKDGGNVGLGITNPQHKLHVVGNTRIQGDAVVTGNWEVQGTTTYIDTYTAVTSNVTIENASGNGPALRVTQSGVGANYPIADFYDNDVSTTVPALRIADGGNVGIGTRTPGAQLSVFGTGQATISTYDTTQNTGGTLQVIDKNSTVGNGGAILFGTYQGNFAAIKSMIENGNNNSTGHLGFYTRNATTDATLTNRVTITNLGNVGIGTTNPTQKLHVQGNILSSGSTSAGTQFLGLTEDTVAVPSFSWTGDTNTGMYHPGADKLGLVTAGVERVSVLANGNVGIGTTNPQATLHVINNTANSTLMQLGYTGYNGINVSVGANNASGAPDYIYMGCKPSMSGGSGGGNFEPFITLVNTLPRNYADLCLVQNGGNVGIGITNPQAKLHVSGGILLSNDILSSYDSTLYGSTTAYATPVFLKIGYKALTVGNGNGGVLVSAGDIQIKAQGLSWSVAESDEPKGGEIYIQGGRSAFGTPGSGSSGSVIIRTHGTSRTTGFDRLTVTGNGTIVFNAYGAGTVSTNSSGVITVSDGRYKSKTRTLNTGLEQVMLLKPTYYKWNADSPWASEYEELGFVAQEVALVIPEASPEPEQADKFRNYHDRAILAVAIKAIQELKVEIEILKEKLAQMTSSS